MQRETEITGGGGIIGISFYSFRVISYIIDVYRGTLKAEKKFINYALYVAFFPQLVAGPIERAGNLLSQFSIPMKKFHYSEVKSGLLIMLWGFMEKIVISDRIAIVVNQIYGNISDYKGSILLLGTVLYAIQIYCDFCSYSDIARGAARVMGFATTKNFYCPYFADTVSNFWKRWHISLSTWFRDYVYIPLGGNRCGKLKRYRNIFIVFFLSGLWHGASWHYCVWGILHAIYQIAGHATQLLRDRLVKLVRIDRQSVGHRYLKIIITFCLIDFAWIFFRSTNLSSAFFIIKTIVLDFQIAKLFDGTLKSLGLTTVEWISLIVFITALFKIQYINNSNNVLKKLEMQHIVIRWGTYFFLTLIILLFAIIGFDTQQEFIYSQF